MEKIEDIDLWNLFSVISDQITINETQQRYKFAAFHPYITLQLQIILNYNLFQVFYLCFLLKGTDKTTNYKYLDKI